MQADLTKFLHAQDDPRAGFDTALRELRAGRKTSHWIWYILPQFEGLGGSPAARRFGLRGLDEAVAYLEHPLLRARLLAVVTAIAAHLGHSPPAQLIDLMGSPIDAQKLVSSMTLFEAVAMRLAARHPDDGGYRLLARQARAILDAAERQGMPVCGYTSGKLSAWG